MPGDAHADMLVRFADDADLAVRVVGDQTLDVSGAATGELVTIEAGQTLGTRTLAEAGIQPLDSDLTAIAALSTTAFGRSFLDRADAAAARTLLGLGTAATTAATDYQPVDSDLTAIAALSTTSFGRSFLALADAAAARTLLALGSVALLSADNVLPWHVDVNMLATPDSHVNWGGTPVVNAAAFMAAYRQNSAGAQNDEATWNVVLAAGTYDFILMHYKSSNRGIYKLSLGGSALTALGGSATTIDGYSAGNAVGYDTITGIVVPTTAKYALRLLLDTKNASSSSYFGTVTWAHFRRTA